MQRFKQLAFALLIGASLCSTAWSSIAFVQSAKTISISTTQVTTTPSLSFAVGDDVFLFPGTNSNTITANSCSDGSNTWTKVGESRNSGGSHQMYVALFHSVIGTAVGSVTCTFSASVAGNAEQQALEYSGVAALGTNTTVNSGSSGSTNPSASITTVDNNDFVIAGFSAFACVTYTAQNGTIRTRAANNCTIGQALIENSSASPASVTDSATISSQPWAGIAVALRSTTGGGGATCANYIALMGAGCK